MFQFIFNTSKRAHTVCTYSQANQMFVNKLTQNSCCTLHDMLVVSAWDIFYLNFFTLFFCMFCISFFRTLIWVGIYIDLEKHYDSHSSHVWLTHCQWITNANKCNSLAFHKFAKSKTNAIFCNNPSGEHFKLMFEPTQIDNYM